MKCIVDHCRKRQTKMIAVARAFCHTHHNQWLKSSEYHRALVAVADFARRNEQERRVKPKE